MAGNSRLKAQDIFNQANFLFGKKVAFAEAFPEIDTIRLEYSEKGVVPQYYHRLNAEGEYAWCRTDKNAIGEFINCSNPLCYNGGINVGHVIREMVKNREETKEGSAICQGNEGSPKGRRIYRSCLNYFKYKITITYKDNEKQPAE